MLRTIVAALFLTAPAASASQLVAVIPSAGPASFEAWDIERLSSDSARTSGSIESEAGRLLSKVQ